MDHFLEKKTTLWHDFFSRPVHLPMKDFPMGYSTDFDGALHFATEPTVSQIAHLRGILGEDVRDHAHWPKTQDFFYIDLELTDDLMGVQWNGAEKTGGLCEQVNYVTTLMRQKWPDFAFAGKLDAQGEERGDAWQLVIDASGVAKVA
jgi:hypothetical protein